MQEEWEMELHIRGILIFLEPEKKLMKDLSYFKLNLIMREASVKKKDLMLKKLSTEMTEKDEQVKKLSSEMAERKGMLANLLSQLSSQGMQLNMPSQFPLDSDVSHFLCC